MLDCENLRINLAPIFLTRIGAVLGGFVSLPSQKLEKMKEGIHPDNYRLVVFKDMSNEYAFLSKSAAETKETIQWEDGNEYPLIKVEEPQESSFLHRKGSVCGHRGTNRQVPSEVRKVRQEGGQGLTAPHLQKRAWSIARLFFCLHHTSQALWALMTLESRLSEAN